MLPIALMLFGGLCLAFALHDGRDEEPDDPPILGDDTDNTLLGTEGDDQILALAGNDRLSGAAGNDALDGGAGRDSLYGGLGDDSLFGGTGPGVLDGGEGRDLLQVLQGFGQLDGGAGDDRLISVGPNQLIGNDGNDIFQFDVLENDDQPYPTLMDFTPGQDKVEIHYTPVPGSEPEVFLNPDPSAEGANSYLEFNGRIIAYVIGEFGLGAQDIILVPKTT